MKYQKQKKFNVQVIIQITLQQKNKFKTNKTIKVQNIKFESFSSYFFFILLPSHNPDCCFYALHVLLSFASLSTSTFNVVTFLHNASILGCNDATNPKTDISIPIKNQY